MDLNSIVFAGLFIVMGGMGLLFIVSFLAYKVRNKQTYKFPVQNYQPQEYFQPQPASVPIQYYQVPVHHQPRQYNYHANQQPIQNYRRNVSLYQVYN